MPYGNIYIFQYILNISLNIQKLLFCKFLCILENIVIIVNVVNIDF